MDIEKLSLKYKDYVKKIREELHQYPEVDFEEYKTSEIIQRELNEMNIPYSVVCKTGVVALIKGSNEGKTVLLRADIDGLPIKEETNLSFKSLNDGFMHACGHDVHTACLLGVAKILNEIKSELSGNIKLVFQPAEEGMGGAEPMINEGILTNPDVNAAFAFHVEPLEKIGNIQIKNGAIMGSPDEFTINITGRGGHGSAPHQCIDPILIASMIIQEYQTIVRKKISAQSPCVVSICSVHSGTCHNVIPSTAKLEGTVRTLDKETRKTIVKELEISAKNIANSMGGNCEFEYNPLYPPLINNSGMNKYVEDAAKKLNCNVIHLENATLAGDDFAYFAEKVPSSYFKIGAGNEDIAYPIHNSKFDVDDNTYFVGTAMMTQIAIDFLNN